MEGTGCFGGYILEIELMRGADGLGVEDKESEIKANSLLSDMRSWV
jgi:hypothetical protein